NSGDDLSRIGIRDGHHFVVATRKQAAILDVDSQTAGFLAGCQRPARFYVPVSRVEGHNLTLVLNVYEDFSRPGAHAELGFAAERNGTDNRAGGGLDGGRVMAAAVEG